MAIPRIIHYCWLSDDPLPDLIRKCIESWNEKLQGYAMILWDSKKIKEIESIWLNSAIQQKKWAFAADYIRCYALYNYGGIYLDSDVEVKKDFESLLHLPYFVGKEKRSNSLEAAVIGSEKKMPWLKACLDFYENKTFETWMRNSQEYLIPVIMRKLVEEKFEKLVVLDHVPGEYEDGAFYLFDAEFFSPLDNFMKTLYETSSTFAIHWFNGAWESPYQKRFKEIKKYFYERNVPWLGTMVAALFAIKEKVKPNYEH